jgi:anaerobic selenocysteine-containing dehydrogenase
LSYKEQGCVETPCTSKAVKAIQAMRKLDSVLASDVVLSSKSLYADIVMPDTLQWEMYSKPTIGNANLLKNNDTI